MKKNFHLFQSAHAGAMVIVAALAAWPPEFASAEDPDVRRDALGAQLARYYTPPGEFAGKLGHYRSPLQFADGSQVRTPEDWRRRRQEILARWHERLGAWPPLVEKPEVRTLETVEKEGYTQYHVHVQISTDGKLADGYLLVPKGEGPFPAVLVPFYEPLTSIGQGENGRGRGTHDYGLQLVRRGFVTLSIGTPGSVEKIGLDTRQLLTLAGQEQRRQPLTLLAYVAANCHTALAQMANVDKERIGIIGLSYGGKWTMFASCLYDKFACAVWSDPGIVFNEKNGNVNYWEPWYLGYDPQTQRKPGVPSADNPRTGLYKQLVEAGDDLVDLHALMAPRPVLVSGGTEDPPQNWQALNHLVAVNHVLGYKDRVAMTSRKTHVPTAEALELELAFLEYWLGTRPAQNDDAAARLDGVWIPQAAELAGRPFSPQVLKTMKLMIQGDAYTVTVGEQKDRGKVSVNANARPAQIDIVGEEGPHKDKKMLAILELEGDTLRICYDLSGQERPKEFATREGTQLFLVTYRREKP